MQIRICPYLYFHSSLNLRILKYLSSNHDKCNLKDIIQNIPVVKNPPANTGDARSMGLILGSGRSPGLEMATHSNILAWKIPWKEEPGGLHRVAKSRTQLS